jgi:penicillin-binding protein 2
MAPLSGRSAQPVAGFERRLAALILFISILFLGLAGYFWFLQITGHDRYQRLSDNNRIRLVEMPATRGIVRDAGGVILADSTPSYNLVVIPEDMEKDREEEVRRLALLLELDPQRTMERLREYAGEAPYRAVPLAYNLDEGKVALFEVSRDSFPGAVLRIEPRRYYPFGKTAAHVLGYVGEVSRDQLKAGEFPGARRGDIVGKYALERNYDWYLRGHDGGRQVEVDARGRELAVLGITDPVPGADLSLTIDLELQKLLEAELAEKRGAGVILDIRSGAVLAMASEPAFDPNEFSIGISRAQWDEIVKDPGHPLQSRAISGLYPPGSTFKVVTAMATLMEETVEPDQEIRCRGSYRFGRRTYRDWKLSGHGKVDFFRSLVESCDVYYYQAGEKLGIDRLASWGRVMGLGQATGIDLPGEKDGLMPSSVWKLRARGEQWYDGETLSVAIGQGYLLATPLQMASLYATIARSGEVLQPYIVNSAQTVNGEELYFREPSLVRRLPVEEEVWQRIREGLAGVVSDPKGTGRGARVRDFPVAGKTGTAQVVRLQEGPRDEDDEVPYEFRDHGWFAAYAPAEDPAVAAAVVVEHGGNGSSSAAPIVRKLFEKYRELYVDEAGKGEKEKGESDDDGQ